MATICTKQSSGECTQCKSRENFKNARVLSTQQNKNNGKNEASARESRERVFCAKSKGIFSSTSLPLIRPTFHLTRKKVHKSPSQFSLLSFSYCLHDVTRNERKFPSITKKSSKKNQVISHAINGHIKLRATLASEINGVLKAL